MEKVLLGGGCFWGIEDKLRKVPGVVATRVGYAGGQTDSPTYDQVCRGDTGHAEVVEVCFDPKRLPFEKLLETFWLIHNPTTRNRQGPDIGSQYRSAVLTSTGDQTVSAQKSRDALNSELDKEVVTEIVQGQKFFPAEDYHQQYLAKRRGDAAPLEGEQ